MNAEKRASQALPTPTSTTSTGHAILVAFWLDTHYLVGQPEYEALLRSIGFQPGSYVLDAGCGGELSAVAGRTSETKWADQRHRPGAREYHLG